MKGESVGNVKLKYFQSNETLKLESGKTLKDIVLAYETYGTLNEDKSNAILICHALSGNAHAAGWHEGDRKAGWWEIIIGPNKALDTEKYFLICSNFIGGCDGSTGPSSINPETGKEYGLDFPVLTVKDMVSAQKLLIDYFEIDELFAVIGGSMGGMQTLQWMICYPDIVKKAIPIATTSHSSPQQIAFNEVGRQAIISDPEWNHGDYYPNGRINGLSIARMIAHITYLSDASMYEKFGRDLQYNTEISYNFSTEFQVESYLHHQGNSFIERFDANSYLYITKAIDYFDLTKNGSLIEGLKDVKSKTLVVSVDSDWLYPPSQSKEIVTALNANEVDVSYAELQSTYGHDAFLLEGGQLNYLLKNFLGNINAEDIMTKNPITISNRTEIEEAATVMMDKNITHIPVVNSQNKLIGIVTAWDLSKSIATHTDNLEAIMTRNVLTCKYNEKIEDIARKMKEFDFSSLPVVDDEGKLIGIVTTEQINHSMLN
ncbi:MAG: homoserine O-acetyltransferase [Methanobrevibacter sp.]|jgi:homoserine O-acetyltransferase|nr:homoserine O-acetyltransferase [Candidatus Methanoflexus mossambicus]